MTTPATVMGQVIHYLHCLPLIDADTLYNVRRFRTNPAWWKPERIPLHDRVTTWMAEGRVMRAK
jgi:hypothetical protein